MQEKLVFPVQLALVSVRCVAGKDLFANCKVAEAHDKRRAVLFSSLMCRLVFAGTCPNASNMTLKWKIPGQRTR